MPDPSTRGNLETHISLLFSHFLLFFSVIVFSLHVSSLKNPILFTEMMIKFVLFMFISWQPIYFLYHSKSLKTRKYVFFFSSKRRQSYLPIAQFAQLGNCTFVQLCATNQSSRKKLRHWYTVMIYSRSFGIQW